MDLEIADRIEMRCTRMLERSIKGLPDLLNEENWKGVSGVAHGRCRDTLVLGMLKARKGEDLKEVFDIFCDGASAAEYLLKVPASHLPLSRLDIPIFICLITGRFNLAQLLAKRIKEEDLKFVQSSHFDLHTKMISGFILSDIKAIESNEKKLFQLTKIHWWDRQRLYFEMYKNIVNRNIEAFTTNLNDVREYFSSRKKDRRFGDQLLEYGGMNNNQFTLDFMALGIISYAIHNYLEVDYSSEFVPKKLLVYANAGA
jgi:hypothetical protein